LSVHVTALKELRMIVNEGKTEVTVFTKTAKPVILQTDCAGREVSNSDGSGSKIFDPGWVRNLWFGFDFGKFLLKMSIFSIFFPSD